MCSTIVGRYNLMTANFNHQNDYMHKGIKIGIIGAIVIIVGASAFYLASPLFISTEIDEPLPEGAKVPSSSPSDQFQEFMAMSEEERIEAGSQMNEQEKNILCNNKKLKCMEPS